MALVITIFTLFYFGITSITSMTDARFTNIGECLWDNVEMDFVYQQIGLSDDPLQETVSNLTLEVLNVVAGADSGPSD